MHQGNPHSPGMKLYFLAIVILVQILGIWKRIIGHITRRTPISSPKVKLQGDTPIHVPTQIMLHHSCTTLNASNAIMMDI